LHNIYIHGTRSGELRSTTHPGSDELGFALHFEFSGRFPDSRVHEAFAAHLAALGINWIRPRRNLCDVDLDAARGLLPQILKAAWIQGRAAVEPEIEVGTRAMGRADWAFTRVVLRLVRNEVVLNQKSRIFLSHRGANKPRVQHFYNVLDDLGFDPWFDKEDITLGSTLHRSLDEGMSASCAAVFFITPQFQDEKFLKYEIDLAMRERTAREPRFNIITLSLSDDSGSRGIVPQVLRTFVFGEPESELEALVQILRALPLKVGEVSWR